MQILILVLTLGVGVGNVHLTFSTKRTSGSGNLSIILGIVALLFVVAIVVAVAVPVLRRRILNRVKPWIDEVMDTVRSLRSISKLAQLFGGNFAAQVVFAAALGLCLRSFGGHLNLATLMVVYVAAALFGGLMPVPGGIGVVEAALMTGLIAAGIPSATATATAIVFRIATFYLPPIWGWVAFRWLQRNSYL